MRHAFSIFPVIENVHIKAAEQRGFAYLILKGDGSFFWLGGGAVGEGRLIKWF